MLDNPEYNYILTEKFDLERLQTFMSSLCVYITISLILVYLEVITNIQC